MISINKYLIIFAIIPVSVILICLITISFILSSSRKHIYKNDQDAPNTQAALILGAGILRNGNLSPVLKDRTDQAIDLYKAEKVEKIIASGNNSSSENREVEPVRDYLIKSGIPKEDILVDYAGFDTYSSIYRAKEMFTLQSITIVSQSFHLPRAVFIGRKLGLEAIGVSADRGHYKLTNYFREMLADIKAVANIISNRSPKLPGEISVEANKESLGHIIPLW